MSFKKSAESAAFEKALGTMAQGESWTYARLSQEAGFDALQHSAKLYKVRDRMRRNGRAVIEILPKEGVRRLLDSEVVNRHSSGYLKRVRNASARGAGANYSVDYSQLGQADQTRHNVVQAAFGAMKLLGSKKAQATIEGGLDKARLTLPPKEVLKLFK